MLTTEAISALNKKRYGGLSMMQIKEVLTAVGVKYKTRCKKEELVSLLKENHDKITEDVLTQLQKKPVQEGPRATQPVTSTTSHESELRTRAPREDQAPLSVSSLASATCFDLDAANSQAVVCDTIFNATDASDESSSSSNPQQGCKEDLTSRLLEKIGQLNVQISKLTEENDELKRRLNSTQFVNISKVQYEEYQLYLSAVLGIAGVVTKFKQVFLKQLNTAETKQKGSLMLEIGNKTYEATPAEVAKLGTLCPLSKKIKILARIVGLDLLNGSLKGGNNLEKWDAALVADLCDYASRTYLQGLPPEKIRAALSDAASQARNKQKSPPKKRRIGEEGGDRSEGSDVIDVDAQH